MLADLLLVVLLVGAFVLAFVQGVIRQLLGIGAWLVAFLVAANLRGAFGSWLAGHWTQFSLAYNEMLAFAIVFLALLIPSLVVIQASGGTVELTRNRLFDDLLAGFLGLSLGLLILSAVIVILDTFYASPPSAPLRDITLLRDIHQALARSDLSNGLRSSLIPGLGAIMGPLLPVGVRAVM